MKGFPIIVVGTYEEFVLGYKPRSKAEGTKCELHQTFATHSHQASVRCVASHKHLMASSGADEYINVYDMTAMEVSTVINYHNSTVTCLEFTPDGSHLITANQNGDIAIFRCKDWTLVKLWKEAHKHANGITSTSVHPSGSLLLTTGADNIIRFWNLIKGRQAYATNFSKKCSVGNSLNFGVWSTNGDLYAICIGSKVEIYKTDTAAVIYEITTSSRATCVAFTKKNLVCIGIEEGNLEIHNASKKKLLVKHQVHQTRVKIMAYFFKSIIKNEKKKLENYIITGESKGTIKLWLLKKKGLNYSLELKGEVDCGCRITCLAMVASNEIKEEKIDSQEVTDSNEKLESSVLEVSVQETNSKNSSNNIEIRKNVSKKPQKRVLENGFGKKNVTPQLSGKSRKHEIRMQISKTKDMERAENGKYLNKKRKVNGIDFREKQGISIKSTETTDQFKKKKYSNSLKSQKSKMKKMTGKWSVEDNL